MTHEVEIALVGVDVREILPIRGRPWEAVSEAEAAKPWAERGRRVLLVDDDEPLKLLLDRASAEFGLYENRDWSLGFGTGRFLALRDDDSPLALDHRLRSWLTLIADDGQAIWGVSIDHEHIPYGRVRSAATAGALKGDASRLYFNVRLIPAGGGVFTQWDLLIQAWRVALDVAGTVTILKGGAVVAERVCERLRGREVVERRMSDWLRRNGWVNLLEQTLEGEPWRARNLGGLLGCTTDEAASVLALYGYVESGGVWTYGAGDPTQGIDPADLASRVVVAFRREVIARCGDFRGTPVADPRRDGSLLVYDNAKALEDLFSASATGFVGTVAKCVGSIVPG